MKQINGMIDIHAHILPRADDGSRYVGETLELLRESYRQGVQKIVATPHYIHGRNRMDSDAIRRAVLGVQKIASGVAADLMIYQGQELLYFDGAIDYLKAGRILTLGGTRYVLVEFLPSVPFGEIEMAVRNLIFAGYHPVLAHIERYQCLRKKGHIDELIHAGACMQMNFNSLTSVNHIGDRTWSRKVLLEGKIHLLGSDMHRLDYRPPQLEKAAAWLSKRGGKELLETLTWNNPLKVLAGKPIGSISRNK